MIAENIEDSSREITEKNRNERALVIPDNERPLKSQRVRVASSSSS